MGVSRTLREFAAKIRKPGTVVYSLPSGLLCIEIWSDDVNRDDFLNMLLSSDLSWLWIYADAGSSSDNCKAYWGLDAPPHNRINENLEKVVDAFFDVDKATDIGYDAVLVGSTRAARETGPSVDSLLIDLIPFEQNNPLSRVKIAIVKEADSGYIYVFVQDKRLVEEANIFSVQRSAISTAFRPVKRSFDRLPPPSIRLKLLLKDVIQ